MSIVERPARTMTEQAVDALASYEPQIDMILSYADLTVAQDGIGKVEEAHKAVKRLRVDLDKKRKELNEGALHYQRTVNATAKTLTEKISAVESRLEAERENYEFKKLEEKQAKEAAKQAALNERVQRLPSAGVVVSDLAALSSMAADEFEFYFARESRIAAEAKAEAERLEAAHQAELRRQAEELRVRAAEMERQRLADEAAMAEERARLKAEREAAEAKQAEERKALEAERAERARIEAEERKATEARIAEERRIMEADRAEMRRQQEEVARQQEELRVKAEAEAAEKRRVEREAKEAARMEALKPEIEKAEKFSAQLKLAAIELLKSLGEPEWSDIAFSAVELCGDHVVNGVRNRS